MGRCGGPKERLAIRRSRSCSGGSSREAEADRRPPVPADRVRTARLRGPAGYSPAAADLRVGAPSAQKSAPQSMKARSGTASVSRYFQRSPWLHPSGA